MQLLSALAESQIRVSHVAALLMATWTDEETYKLIELWGEDKIQAELEGCKRNAHIFEKITREMAGASFDRSGT